MNGKKLLFYQLVEEYNYLRSIGGILEKKVQILVGWISIITGIILSYSDLNTKYDFWSKIGLIISIVLTFLFVSFVHFPKKHPIPNFEKVGEFWDDDTKLFEELITTINLNYIDLIPLMMNKSKLVKCSYLSATFILIFSLFLFLF